MSYLKKALHLIEDVPTNASYTAFKHVAEILNDNPSESYDVYELRPISDDEKMSLIKKVHYFEYKDICLLNIFLYFGSDII